MRAFSVYACFFLLTITASAQYRFDTWTANTGLPQNIIRGIHQARDGYLWVVTLNGLARFDGVRFTIFDRSNSPGIVSNRFTSLYEDAQGDLWLGSEVAGLTRYHQGRFTTYDRGKGSGSIAELSGDDAGNIWSLRDRKVLRWVPSGESAGEFQQVADNFPDDLYRSDGVIQRDGRGGFWAASRSAFFWFHQGRMSSWTRRDGLPSLRVRTAAEDEHGTLWISTEDAGLARIENGKVVKIYGASDGLPGNWNWFVSGPAIKLVSRDPQGDLWTTDLNTWSSTLLARQPPRALVSLPQYKLYEDRERNLWIGSEGGGLFRARRQVITSHLTGQNFYPVFADRSGAVWVGSRDVSRFKDGTVTTYPIHGDPGLVVSSFGEDREGRLWIWAGGSLRTFDGHGFRIGTNMGIQNPFSASVIYYDATGTLWLGTDMGLLRYQNGVSQIFSVQDGLAVLNIKIIIEGRGGALWLAGYGGLARLLNGKFTNWGERDGLPSDNVRTLYEDPDGVLWIGTYDGGLGRMKDGGFTRYTTREGLFNDGVFQILEDAHGYFWMSCNRGIYRVRKQELNEFAAGKRTTITSISYGKSEGMANVECNGGLWPPGSASPDGRLWFPTQDGVAVIDPEAVPRNPDVPPVRIEAFLLDRAPLNLDLPVRVEPGQENFEIQYTALSFINSEQIKFKYRLDGLDGDWTDAGARRSAYYSRVPPGKYVFRVTAANSDGVWNTAGTSFAFVVVPPYYRTWWFLTVASLSAVGMLRLAWHRRVATLERAQAAQEDFSRQLIASQESERKRIAGELHDSLGQHLLIIKNWAMLALNAPGNSGPVREPLAEISTTASQAIDEVRGIAYNLRPYQLEKLGLTTAIEDLVDRIAASSEIRFATQVDPVDDIFPEEVEISVYRIIQEVLNNMVRHSLATKAQVLVSHKTGLVKLTLQDDGQGFTPPDGRVPDLASGRSTATRKGFGLVGIAERVRMLGGQLTIQSAPGSGTTIGISLKTWKEVR